MSGPASVELRSTSKRGRNAYVNRTYNTTENRVYYETRGVSAANKVNLELPEAIPELVNGLVQSLCGLL